MDKAKPTIFSGPMVKAILDNRKNQTRRVLKVSRRLRNKGWEYPIPSSGRLVIRDGYAWDDEPGRTEPLSGYLYQPGDLLWVKETCWIWGRWHRNGKTLTGRQAWRFKPIDRNILRERPLETAKRGGGDGWVYRNARFMPRWASRITLEVTGTRIERMQEISEEDAKAEGVPCKLEGSDENQWGPLALLNFGRLWTSLYPAGPKSWDANPWVVVIEFKRVEQSP